MSVLVTGVSGLVGVAAAAALLKRGATVVGLSRNGLSAMARKKLASHSFREERGDVRDFDGLMRLGRAHAFTQIIHAAGVAGSSKAASDPLEMVTTNLLGIANVLEAGRRLGVSRIVYTSSSAVYGPRPDGRPIREEEVSPRSQYGELKWMGEVLAARYRQDFGLDTVIARLFSVYGPFQKPGGLDVGYGVVHYLCSAAVAGRPLHLPSAGTYHRGYTFVDDVADGLCRLLFAARLSHSVYNIASGRSYTLAELADAIRKLIPEADIEVGSGLWEGGPPSATLRGALDITRARQDLDFEPSYTLEEGIGLFIEHLRRAGISQHGAA